MDEKQIRKALGMKEIKKGVEDYLKIKGKFDDHTVNLATNRDFQRTYNGFYKVIFRPEMFYKDYYSFMEKHKDNIPSFTDALRYFLNQYDKLEASFSSKLLHTIKPSLPIWDKYVLKHFFSVQDEYIFEYLDRNFIVKKCDKETRIRYASNVYEDLKIKYNNFLETKESDEWIELFENYYPKYKDDITRIKKIDFIIWAVGKLEKMEAKKKTRT
jgi:hypothetical protein